MIDDMVHSYITVNCVMRGCGVWSPIPILQPEPKKKKTKTKRETGKTCVIVDLAFYPHDLCYTGCLIRVLSGLL